MRSSARVRTLGFSLALLLPGFVGQAQATAGTTVWFDTDLPGTIEDHNGLGTGFTHRLPGTGASLGEQDANLELGGGFLSITSTRSGLMEGWGRGEAEALGVFLPGVGTKDLRVEALFRDIQLHNSSDHLVLYVGTSSERHIHGGPHCAYPTRVPQWMVQSLCDEDAFTWTTPPASETDPAKWAKWSAGDDLRLTLSRTSRLWRLSWENLTNGAEGSSPWFSFPCLDSSQDLYAGVHYANPRSHSPNTSQMEYFSVHVVPEPSTLVLSGMGAIGLVACAWRRRRRAA